MSFEQRRFPHLLALPEHLLFEVFMKINNIPLCRIRKTCKFMDNFAEKCKKQLSSRLEMGIDLSFIFCIYLMGTKEKIVIRGAALFEDGRRRSNFEFNYDLEKCLSAIPLKKLQPVRTKEKAFKEALRQLGRLQLRCVQGEFVGLPAEWLVEIANLIYCRDEIHVLKKETDLEKALPIFSKIRDRQKVDMSLFRPTVPGLFHLIKNFKSIISNCSVTEFHKLIWDIYRSTESFKLQSFENDFTSRRENTAPIPFDSGIGPYPNFEVLWKLSPEEQENFQSRTPKHIPFCVRIMELPFNYAFIVETRCETYYTRVTIDFLAKTAESVLDKFIELLQLRNFGDDRRKEYCNATAERRKEMLRSCVV